MRTAPLVLRAPCPPPPHSAQREGGTAGSLRWTHIHACTYKYSTCEEKGREEKKTGGSKWSLHGGPAVVILFRASPSVYISSAGTPLTPPHRHTPPAMVYHKPRKSCLDCRRRHLKCSLPDGGGSASCVWCQEHGLECVKDWEAADSGPLRSQPAKDG